MRRISIVGGPGSGKSTLAAKLAKLRVVPHIELDALHHQAGWVERKKQPFRDALLPLVQQPEWVCDGNYASKVQDLVWSHADTVVWLDLPRRVVFPALAARTLRRGLTRQELWNGNKERPLQVFDPRPEHNVLMWAVTRYASYRQRYSQVAHDPTHERLRFVRLCSRDEVARFVKAHS